MFLRLSPTSDNVCYVRLAPSEVPGFSEVAAGSSASSQAFSPEVNQGRHGRSCRVRSIGSHAAERQCEPVEEGEKVTASEVLASKDMSSTPEACNTGVSIRHGSLESGGLDTLEVSLYGGWNAGVFDELKRRLDKAKSCAESGTDGAYIISAEGDQLEVAGHGVTKGVGCRWCLSWNGCKIAIVNSWMYSETRLSIHVSIGSLRLMQVGHQEAWQSLLAVLASIGYEHVRDVVGRADLCTDHADRTMLEVEQAINGKQLICRARKSKRYENADKLETYVRGAGPLLVRIYDKGVECRNDPVKQAVLIERRWGQHCDNAVRVEFQLRNKALRRHFSIRTVAELFESLGTVAAWCNTEWFRIVNDFDRKNRNHARAQVSEFWTEVQEAFQTWTGTALPRVPQAKKLVPDFKQLKRQAVGCVAAIAAHVDGRRFIESWVEIGRELRDKAEEAIEQKRIKLAAASRLHVSPDNGIPF